MTLRPHSTLHGLLAAALMALVTAACGGGSSQPPAPAAPAAQNPSATSAPAAAPGVVSIIEPAEGSSSGHISLFRWAAVEGADGYRMRLNASTDGRTIWDSPRLTETEAHLPNTVPMEPEGYVWTVTALKGEKVIASSPVSRFTVTP